MTAKVGSLTLAILAGIALVIAGILGATSHAIPEQLWTVIYVLVGGTAGVTLPTVTTSSAATPAVVSSPGSSTP